MDAPAPQEPSPQESDAPSTPKPRWQPLAAIERRVLGVLVEKAKTTPDAYPMSLNGICTGANQKSNRHPLMELEPEDVEESLARLRQVGAVGMVEGHGRVTKYRHYFYDWLGVDKVEAAVMAELLLRGTQTEGELRGRAARMEPIPDLSALRPILASLKAKGLVVSVTPEGRGHVVTHALHAPKELERIMAEHRGAPAAAAAAGQAAAESLTAAAPRPAAPGPAALGADAESLRRQLDDLRAQVSQLRADLEEVAAAQRRSAEEVRRLREDLGA